VLTAAFEVVEQLGSAPDWLALPVGNGGNITAYWMGFGEIGAAPHMLAGQAEGAAPLVAGRPVLHPETVATAIRVMRKPSSFCSRRTRAVVRRSLGGEPSLESRSASDIVKHPASAAAISSSGLVARSTSSTRARNVNDPS